MILPVLLSILKMVNSIYTLKKDIYFNFNLYLPFTTFKLLSLIELNNIKPIDNKFNS